MPLDPHDQELPPQPAAGDSSDTGSTVPSHETDDSSRGSSGGAIYAPELVDEHEHTIISSGEPLPVRPSALALRPRDLGETLEGTTLGHYRLQAFIGGGGMGAVFRAHDTELDRVVAIKVLAEPGGEPDDEVQQRFRNEAQSAARLDHPNIARVYDVGVETGLHFIVFEYIDGINVRDHVAALGPLTQRESLDYTLQIAQALAHASARDVVHRDIKPSNILLTRDGQAKLVDMGLARLHDVETVNEDLTASGVTLGTFDYIAPEQARDPRGADTRSDIYSLGCTLFFMLTGRPPFPSGTLLQKLLRHQSEPPANVQTIRPEVPPQVDQLVQKMLAKAAEARFQNPDELIASIEEVAAAVGVELPSSLPMVRVTRVPIMGKIKPHLPWAVPLLLLLTAVVLVEWHGRTAASDLQFPESSELQEGPRGGPREAGPISGPIPQSQPKQLPP